MFFAIFVEQACKKRLKTRCFLHFLTRFWAKKAKNTRFFAFFGQNVPAKIYWGLGPQPPQKNQTVISDSVISVPTGDWPGRQPVLANPKP